MPTATKNAKPETISAIKEKAVAAWRRWAHALATTGTLPPTGELLEAVGLLGRNIEDLERDADFLREYEAMIVQRDFWKAAIDKVEAERGPIEDVRARIAQAEEELEELRQLERAGHSESWQFGTAKGKVEMLRNRRPDLFGDNQ